MFDLILLLVLLAFSAFFSASETALFSLDRERLSAYAASANPLRRLVARLLAEPRKLLITILLGNLGVNVFFYAVASGVALRASVAHGPLAGAALGVAAPVVVIIFGEVTPKTLALGFPGTIAALAAPLLSVVRVVG